MGNRLQLAAWAVAMLLLNTACGGADRHGHGVRSQAAEAIAVASVAAVLTGVQMARQGSVDLRPIEENCTLFCTGCTYPCGDICVPYATLCAEPPGTACMGGDPDLTPEKGPHMPQSDCDGTYWKIIIPTS